MKGQSKSNFKYNSRVSLLQALARSFNQWICSILAGVEIFAQKKGVKSMSESASKFIGRNIQMWRRHVGKEQSDLAKALNLSQPVVSRLETGKAAITVVQLVKIASCLNVSSPDLCFCLEGVEIREVINE